MGLPLPLALRKAMALNSSARGAELWAAWMAEGSCRRQAVHEGEGEGKGRCSTRGAEQAATGGSAGGRQGCDHAAGVLLWQCALGDKPQLQVCCSVRWRYKGVVNRHASARTLPGARRYRCRRQQPTHFPSRAAQVCTHLGPQALVAGLCCLLCLEQLLIERAVLGAGAGGLTHLCV
jgi:hypothetical protein